MDIIIKKIRNDLETSIDSQARGNGQRYFKEQVKIHGVKTALVSKIGKHYFEMVKSRTKAEIFDLCEELLRSGYLEESFIACHWSYFLHPNFEPTDFEIFERWLNEYINNWATCDTFCNHTLGAFMEMFPGYLSKLKDFSKSENKWMRRAAAVTLIIPARKGKFLKEILEIADLLLLDQEDLVQKGYGWMLKAASESHEQAIFDYVMSKKEIMPRTALRYAIEKMPKERRSVAMAK